MGHSHDHIQQASFDLDQEFRGVGPMFCSKIFFRGPLTCEIKWYCLFFVSTFWHKLLEYKCWLFSQFFAQHILSESISFKDTIDSFSLFMGIHCALPQEHGHCNLSNAIIDPSQEVGHRHVVPPYCSYHGQHYKQSWPRALLKIIWRDNSNCKNYWLRLT